MDEKNYKNKRLSEPCRGCLLISALVIFFISVVVATVSSLAVLRTRKWTENFLPTNCTVVDRTIKGLTTCGCGGSYCRSRFLCIQITVRYETTYGATNNNNLTSYAFGNISFDEINAIQNNNCFAQPCAKNEIFNNYTISSYLIQFAVKGKSYPCLYNSKNTHQVISKLHYSNDDVLSAILIPGSLFILSILLVLVSFSPCHVTNPFRIKFTKEALNSAKIFTLKIIEILENILNNYLNKKNEENSYEIEI